jgi:PII-like signaling protein
MQGIYLKFYVTEKQKHGTMPVYEWLLERAKEIGIRGGSAFRAMAGYGRHHRLHEDHFFELQGDLPVEVGFVVTEDEAQMLFDVLTVERLSLFFIKLPCEFGVAGGTAVE